jgi:hypothetical protein
MANLPAAVKKERDVCRHETRTSALIAFNLFSVPPLHYRLAVYKLGLQQLLKHCILLYMGR